VYDSSASTSNFIRANKDQPEAMIVWACQGRAFVAKKKKKPKKKRSTLTPPMNVKVTPVVKP
jgi:hypothetical protein